MIENNVAEMRVVGPKVRYVMTRPEGGWPEGSWDAYKLAFQIEARRGKKDLDSGKISERLLSHRTYRDAMKRFVGETHLPFREELL